MLMAFFGFTAHIVTRMTRCDKAVATEYMWTHVSEFRNVKLFTFSALDFKTVNFRCLIEVT